MKMRVKVIIDGPGSYGELCIEATAAQLTFLRRLAEEFNLANPTHAAPYIKLEPLPPVCGCL